MQAQPFSTAYRGLAHVTLALAPGGRASPVFLQQKGGWSFFTGDTRQAGVGALKAVH